MSHSEERKPVAPAVVPAGFFALRTPMLPIDDFLTWGADLVATTLPVESVERSAALRAEVAMLRARLKVLVARPEVREAIFVASSDLNAFLRTWEADPESARGRRVERALVRYFSRMSARPTPFGLFAGCSVGRLGPRTRLLLHGRAHYLKHTRVDASLVQHLCRELLQQRELRRGWSFGSNTTAYAVSGQLRWVETRISGIERSYHLVAAPADTILRAVLDAATPAAPFGELAAKLSELANVSAEEASEYLEELIDSQLLVPQFELGVTGPEPLRYLLESLPWAGLEDTRRALMQVTVECAALDASALGVDPARYERIEELVREAMHAPEGSRVLQVDLVKPTQEASLT